MAQFGDVVDEGGVRRREAVGEDKQVKGKIDEAEKSKITGSVKSDEPRRRGISSRRSIDSLLDGLRARAASGEVPADLVEAFDLRFQGKGRASLDKFREVLLREVGLREEDLLHILPERIGERVPAEKRELTGLILAGLGQVEFNYHHLDDAATCLSRANALRPDDLETLCYLGDSFREEGSSRRRMGGPLRIKGADDAYGRVIHLLGIDVGDVGLGRVSDGLLGSNADEDSLLVYGTWALNGLGSIRHWQGTFQLGRNNEAEGNERLGQAVRCFGTALGIMVLPADPLKNPLLDVDAEVARLQEVGRAETAAVSYGGMGKSLRWMTPSNLPLAYHCLELSTKFNPASTKMPQDLMAEIKKVDGRVEGKVAAALSGEGPMPATEAEEKTVEMVKAAPSGWLDERAGLDDKRIHEVGIVLGIDEREIDAMLGRVALELVGQSGFMEEAAELVRDAATLRTKPESASKYLDDVKDIAQGWWDVNIDDRTLPVFVKERVLLEHLVQAGDSFGRGVRERAQAYADEYDLIMDTQAADGRLIEELEPDRRMIHDAYTRLCGRVFS